MTSHHHHHHDQQQQCHLPAATTTTTSCCCCYYSTCCAPTPPDPHLQSSLSHIHQHPPPPQPHHYSPHLNPPYETLHHLHHQTPYHPPPTHQQKPQEFQHQPTVSSLLHRIAALESSLLLRRQYSVNPGPSRSLRDAAARTIQTHFREFLVRRSRTLRQLKDLASIKSTLNALKTSLNHNAHLDPQAISRRAMNLLLKLDSIQGGDPMIRDGKRSISRDIIRFMEFMDGVLVKRNELSSIAVKNVRFSRAGDKSRVLYGDEKVLMEKLGARVEKLHRFSMVNEDEDEEDEEGIELKNPRISVNGNGGSSHSRNGGFVKTPQAKVKKSVSFADNGNITRVYASTHEPVSSGDTNSSDGSGSIEEERELVDNLCGEVEEIRGSSKGSEDDEEAHTEHGGYPNNGDGKRNPRTGRNLRNEDSYEISGDYQGENEEFAFSAPMPVKMESRADLMKKRMAVKIVN